MKVYRYQKDAVDWMIQRERKEDKHCIRGGILADHMGMGKTITTLALYQRKPCKTMIVCPLSVVHQWSQEIEKHLGIVPLCIMHRGTIDESVYESDILVVSHTIFSRNPVPYILLKPNMWKRLIVDEAHRMKNPNSVFFQNISLLDVQKKWCLTGTPVVSTIIPTRHASSGSQKKTKDIRSLIMFLSHDIDSKTAFQVSQDPDALQEIMMRRKKDILRHIIKPCHHIHTVELDSPTSQQYQEIYEEGCRIVSHQTEESDLLHIIVSLRMLCATSDAKMEYLSDCVYNLHAGCRILVFCHYMSEIDKVAQTLQSLMHVVLKFTGRVKESERKKMIETFMTPSPEKIAMVIQIDAGGVGLNLQIATHVFLMSPSWSAASEEQAISRAHRVNTAHPVHVHRFLCQDTIEEFIYTRNQDKTETSEKILQDPETEKTLLWDLNSKIFS